MRRFIFVSLAFGCSSEAPTIAEMDASLVNDAATADAAIADAGVPCLANGNPGICISLSACAALPEQMSTAGLCPGSSDIQCCAPTPDVSNNPPIPNGYQLMSDANVTTDMTTWAVSILNDPNSYPMFATTTKMFGSLNVLARVEWHPPDFQNSVVHRGVTLYQPI